MINNWYHNNNKRISSYLIRNPNLVQFVLTRTRLCDQESLIHAKLHARARELFLT